MTETRGRILNSKRFRSYQRRVDAAVRSVLERNYSVSRSAEYWQVDPDDLWNALEESGLRFGTIKSNVARNPEEIPVKQPELFDPLQ